MPEKAKIDTLQINSIYKNKLGRKGEDLACEYLTKHGHRIIERNLRFSMGEIDIVSVTKHHVCFTEVKTRTSLHYGRPSLALNPSKQARIKKMCEIYLKMHKEYTFLSPRIDVIELLFINGAKYINHIKSAF